MNKYTLDMVKQGQVATVVKTTGPLPIKCRIMDMGITNGLNVQVACEAPMGDPMRIWVRGSVLSLRAADAKNVEVKDIRNCENKCKGKRGRKRRRNV